MDGIFECGEWDIDEKANELSRSLFSPVYHKPYGESSSDKTDKSDSSKAKKQKDKRRQEEKLSKKMKISDSGILHSDVTVLPSASGTSKSQLLGDFRYNDDDTKMSKKAKKRLREKRRKQRLKERMRGDVESVEETITNVKNAQGEVDKKSRQKMIEQSKNQVGLGSDIENKDSVVIKRRKKERKKTLERVEESLNCDSVADKVKVKKRKFDDSGERSDDIKIAAAKKMKRTGNLENSSKVKTESKDETDVKVLKNKKNQSSSSIETKVGKKLTPVQLSGQVKNGNFEDQAPQNVKKKKKKNSKKNKYKHLTVNEVSDSLTRQTDSKASGSGKAFQDDAKGGTRQQQNSPDGRKRVDKDAIPGKIMTEKTEEKRTSITSNRSGRERMEKSDVKLTKVKPGDSIEVGKSILKKIQLVENKKRDSGSKKPATSDPGSKISHLDLKMTTKASPFNVQKLARILAQSNNSSSSIAKEMTDHQNSDHSTKVKGKDFGKPQGDEPRTNMKVPSPPLSLKEKMMERLKSARFRFLNEQLYSCSGKEALSLFRDDPEAFEVYHQGFQSQVAKWPSNPLDVIINSIKKKPANLTVADFGSGDAKLARNVPNKVHSFDLVALNDNVTVCDMSKVPLKNSSVDIAVFCLSLMGTNLAEYLCEANRVLKLGGTLKIAEVASRFHKVTYFISCVESLGFQLIQQDTSNKMFYMLDFKKVKPVKKNVLQPMIRLDPCVYKKR